MQSLLAQVEIGKELPSLARFSTLADFINLISRLVAIVGGFLVVASIAYTAYLYISSSGETKNIEKAKMMLTYTVIGMIVIVAAYWLTQIIARFMGQNF